MPRGSAQLTRSQTKLLDLAMLRRTEGHAAVEVEWFGTIDELVTSGVSVRAVSDHLHVSRQTVYDWLVKARSG